MASVLRGTRAAMRGWSLILKWCSYKPRNCGSHQKLEGAKKGCPPRAFGESTLISDVWPPGLWESVCWKPPVCADVLGQPQETDTVLFCIFQASMIVTWCTKHSTTRFFSLFDICSWCYAHFNCTHFLCSVEFHCMTLLLSSCVILGWLLLCLNPLT